MKCILRWPISYVLNIDINVYGYFMRNLPISHFILIIHYDLIKCLKNYIFFFCIFTIEYRVCRIQQAIDIEIYAREIDTHASITAL